MRGVGSVWGQGLVGRGRGGGGLLVASSKVAVGEWGWVVGMVVLMMVGLVVVVVGSGRCRSERIMKTESDRVRSQT